MSDLQARLIAASIALIAGAIACGKENDLDINVGIAITVVASALFVGEYFRAAWSGSGGQRS
jgi:hypothetical protein